MEKLLTISEIFSNYASEWVLIENPETNEAREVLAGTVCYHSANRDDVYRKAVELRPKRFAVLFTGNIPQGTAIVV